ncbi:MAG: PsbP-related protein [Dehalococcoidia bacterium]
MKFSNLIPIILLILVLWVGSSCSCGGGGETPTPTPTPTGTPTGGYLEYIDEDNGLAISYPQGWVVPPQDEWPEGMLAVLEAASACGNYTSRCVVDTRSMPQGSDFPTWFDNSLMYFSTVPKYTLIHRGNTTLDGMEAFEHVFSCEIYEGVPLQMMQLYVAANMTVWYVTCECASDCWSQYETTFDTIVASFRLLD